MARKGKGFKPRNSKPRVERNNFQDMAEVREFRKGERAAAAKFGDSSRKRGKDLNDPNWYFKDPQLLDQIAVAVYGKPLGSRMNIGNMYPQIPNNWMTPGMETFPGLLTISLIPTVGVSNDADSPINVASINAYNTNRYKNAGKANYDNTDLMLYYIAMGSIYSAWTWMQRLYGMAFTPVPENLYKPAVYFEANCVDFEDFQANMADFRNFLNLKAIDIACWNVPDDFTLHRRWAWIFSSIFKDSDLTKAQEYMYVPACFYQYDETSSPMGGKLKTIPVVQKGANNKFKTKDLMNMLNGMISALHYSQDINDMSGDVLKAYGNNTYTLGQIPVDYRVESTFSMEVLTQIENCTIYPITQTDLASFTIYQDPNKNVIMCQPTIAGDHRSSAGYFINLHVNNPTPQDNIVATRLMSTIEVVTGETTITKFTSSGTEIVFDANIYYYSSVSSLIAAPVKNGAWSIHHTPFLANNSAAPKTKEEMVNLLVTICMISSFDWAPITKLITYKDTNNSIFAICGYLADWANWAWVDLDNLQTMNLLAIMTEFGVY